MTFAAVCLGQPSAFGVADCVFFFITTIVHSTTVVLCTLIKLLGAGCVESPGANGSGVSLQFDFPIVP